MDTVGGGTKLGSLSATSTTDIDLYGSVTTGGTQTYTGPAIIEANDTLTTTNSAVDFTSTVDGSSSGTQSLTVSDGTGGTTFTGKIGNGTPLQNLSITGDSLLWAATSSAPGRSPSHHPPPQPISTSTTAPAAAYI